MLSQVVCLVVMLGAALAANNCKKCFSNKFSANMGMLGASLPSGSAAPVITDAVMRMNYDYTAKKMSMQMRIVDQASQQEYNVSVLEDYNTGKRYSDAGPGQCTITDLERSEMTPPCVPANFTDDGMYTLGSSSKNVSIQVYKGMFGKLVMKYHVTTDDCTPVLETMYGDLGTARMMNTYNFGNVQMHDSTIAAAPTDCHTAAPGGIGKRDLERIEVMKALMLPFTN